MMVSGFIVVPFVSGASGGFGSWNFIFASFLSFSPMFGEGKGTMGRELVEFCILMLGKGLAVASIPLVSAEGKWAMKDWLEEGLS